MVCVWAAVASFGCSRPLPAGDPSRPDVVLISVDTLRADHLGAWGYSRDTSPHLDALAASGTRFSDTWSPAPWTLPSHATLLSGLHPAHHGAIEGELALGADLPWLPEVFQRAGYATAGVVTTLFVSDTYGFDRGFDHFHDFGIDDERRNRTANVDAEEVTAHAVRWLAEQGEGQPVFLFLHFYDTHYAYDPPRPYATAFDRAPGRDDPKYQTYATYLRDPLDAEAMAHQVAQYDEAIAYLDATVAALRETWDRAGRRAVWTVVADHGEEFGERGSWGHAHTLWPEQLHVPWVMAGPGVAGQVLDHRVGLEDVAPTLASLAGLPFPTHDGTDRADEVRGHETARGAPAARFAETSRFHTLKYRWHRGPYDLHLDLAAGTVALCDLDADPTCARDVAGAHPDVVRALSEEMWDWLGSPWRVGEPGVLTSEGVFVAEGEPRPKRLAAAAGASFGLHPADAAVTWQGDSGARSGPWQAVGGRRPPSEGPVTWGGKVDDAGRSDLSDAQRAQLEALGYLQEPPSGEGRDGP